jgi:hypothetical protein
VVPETIHDFFLASGGVAGALIGLLFVAISVSAERMTRAEKDAQLYRVRAVAALTSFTNALTTSLFALVPGHKIGPVALASAIGGLIFVIAAIVSLARVREIDLGTARDAVFLLGLVTVFVIQLIAAAGIIATSDNPGNVNTIAILVIFCFLIGIARAWELIGGPAIGLRRQVTEMIRDHNHHPAAPGDGQPPPPSSPPPPPEAR